MEPPMTSAAFDPLVDRLIELAFTEDLGASGDITTRATVPADRQAVATVRAKEDLVLAGVDVFARVFAHLDPRVVLEVQHTDGARLKAGDVVLTARGLAHSLLVGERPALNFMMRLSGVATLTAQMVAAVAGTQAQIVDTRKTTPGWRSLEKAAVRAGGGRNHRFGLFDGVLIKDNHIEAAGSITAAVQGARALAHHLLRIEVECASLAQVQECLDLRADLLLLDNMDDAALSAAVERVRDHTRRTGHAVLLEASGNMTLGRLPAVARTGVDLISMGALTHQATSRDLSMKLRLLA
jgi:nicotinate-nucleotide pyrophosphorylase (carboxylating)